MSGVPPIEYDVPVGQWPGARIPGDKAGTRVPCMKIVNTHVVASSPRVKKWRVPVTRPRYSGEFERGEEGLLIVDGLVVLVCLFRCIGFFLCLHYHSDCILSIMLKNISDMMLTTAV